MSTTVPPEQRLAENAGFMNEVRVSGFIFERLLAQGQSDEPLQVFLNTCANQMKVAYTDNKCWERFRFYYPMYSPAIGRQAPEEVLIVTDESGAVTITATAELELSTIH